MSNVAKNDIKRPDCGLPEKSFVFASFNQAYKRLKYLQQYSEYREKQAELILQTKALIKEKVRSLQTKKHERFLQPFQINQRALRKFFVQPPLKRNI